MNTKNNLEGKKVAYCTLGCKLNFAETSTIGKQLASLGCEKVKKGEEADICIINTCSVTEAANKKDRQAIHKMQKQHPNAIMVITGCYAQLKPHEVASLDGIDFVLGMNEKFEIATLLEKIASKNEAPSIRCSEIRSIGEYHGACSADDRTRHFLKVQDGCDYFCTYCTIPFARGKSRNGTIAEICQLAQEAINKGAKEIVLSGVNIGDFGKTTGETFFDLIKALDNQEGDVRYRISSIEPNLLTDEIIEFTAQSKHFAPHFHIPLQNGCDEMLKIMKRRYDTALFAHKIQRIKEIMPHAFIGVDAIVGARGETPEYFEQARSFIASLDISQLHVFTYSEREGTRMLEIPYKVSAQEKKRRSDVLHQLSAEKLKQFYQSHIGYNGRVLWESKKTEGMMNGFTENYLRVKAPFDSNKINCYESVIVTPENIDPLHE